MSTFTEDIGVWVSSLGPQASAMLANAAHQTEADILAQQRARRGIEPGVAEAVDGQRGKPFEAVRPDGMIWLGFDYRAEIVAACFEELKVRSPVVSGEYVKSHFCMLDGKGLGPLQVPTAAELENVSEIVVTNPMAYSRKLEVGITRDGSPFVKQVEPHIYESTMQAVRREFGQVTKISFGYADLENAYTSKTAMNARARVKRGGRVSKRSQESMRYPCIRILQA